LVDAEGNPMLSEDRDYLSLGDVSQTPSKIIERQCRERGVLISGVMPNSLKLAPPFAITEGEIDYALDVLDDALTVLGATWGNRAASSVPS
jgi:taurine---2-oxoglutarate transaminase